MRLSMSTQTNLICFSPLSEPFPSPVEWDYSAGGAGDGAGKNLFVKSQDRCSLCALYSFQHIAWIYLLWISNTMLADDTALSLSFLNSTVFTLNRKIQIQSWNLISSATSSFFCPWLGGHPLSWIIVCIDKWRQQSNIKRHVNHHPLGLQLHPRAGASVTFSIFSSNSWPRCRSSWTHW